LDAASNNGVEHIRELRESVQYPPTVGRKKVYIIDEVHMLSKGAFNALLKTLEEPPENVMFILATTEPEKLPSTILSRCLKLDFRRVPESVLISSMENICRDKGVETDPGVLNMIAANADGSVRDGLSLLDQCLSAGQKHITRDDVLDFLGTSGEEVFIELTDHVQFHRTSDALLLIDRALADGKDAKQFLKDWLAHYRNLLIAKYVRRPEDMLGMSWENIERVKAQSDSMDLSVITGSIRQLSESHSEAKWSTQPRVILELCAVRLSSGGQNAAMPEQQQVQQPAPQRAPQTPQQSGQQTPQQGQTRPQQPQQKPPQTQQPQQPPQQSQQPQQPAPQPPQQVQQSAPQPAPVDTDRLWHAIFEDGEAAQGSFNLLRSGAKLAGVSDESFVVEASSVPVKDYVEKNRAVLEELMARHTGKKRIMRCVTAASDGSEEGGEPAMTAEEKAAKLGDLMGIKVRVDE
ncbi:MAG: DNA polymerase III subunit gamma/tau, partial [Firmicutes bacterium]|nr:DNA polymerase III subunit gamma/tau [Bacillota bacterium]